MSAPVELSGWLAGWLATYLVHSTIFLLLALVLAPRLRGDAWRETLWRTALLGGLVTATLQIAAAYTPAGGRWALRDFRDAVEGARTVPSAQVTAPRPASSAPGEPPRRVADGSAQTGGRPGENVADPAPAAVSRSAPTAAGQGPGARSRTALLMIVWALGAGALLVRLAVQHALLCRFLQDRRPLTEGRVFRMLAELRSTTGIRAPIRLSASATCPTPVALGRLEICVPERFLTDLDPDQQRSALAHELAHLRRRDPVWQLAAGVVESVLFFQPLNRVARRRLREVAENLCDDWAVRQTKSALGLARCLTDVAAWIGPIPLPGRALAMAAHESQLLQRVQRLVEWKEPSGPPLLLRPLASTALLALIAVAAPGFSHPAPAESAPPRPSRGSEKLAGTTPVETRPMEMNLADTASAGVVELPGSADSLILHPGLAGPLAERWRWALEHDFRGGYWVAWGTDGGVQSPEEVLECHPGRDGCREVVSGGGVISSDSHDPAGDLPNAPSLRERLAGAAADVPRTVFLFRIGGASSRAGEVEWIRLRSSTAPLDLQGRPLVWLGPAEPQQSMAHLGRLYPGLGNAALRKEAAAALAVHSGETGVVQAMREVLKDEASPTVRVEAVKWLSRGQSGGPAVVDYFVATALADPSSDVRHKAVSRLGRIPSPQASAALLELARTAPHADVREEAVDQLADDPAALLRLAREASDARVRREAVKGLAAGRSDDAVSALVQVAFEDPAERVQREAVSRLGQVGSDSARGALARIAETHPARRIRAEAAEALAPDR